MPLLGLLAIVSSLMVVIVPGLSLLVVAVFNPDVGKGLRVMEYGLLSSLFFLVLFIVSLALIVAL